MPEYKIKKNINNPENSKAKSNDFFNHLEIEDRKAFVYLQQAGHIMPYALLEKVLAKQNSLVSGKASITPNFECVMPKRENMEGKEYNPRYKVKADYFIGLGFIFFVGVSFILTSKIKIKNPTFL